MSGPVSRQHELHVAISQRLGLLIAACHVANVHGVSCWFSTRYTRSDVSGNTTSCTCTQTRQSVCCVCVFHARSMWMITAAARRSNRATATMSMTTTTTRAFASHIYPCKVTTLTTLICVVHCCTFIDTCNPACQTRRPLSTQLSAARVSTCDSGSGAFAS